ncbi:MAG: transporter associated domain-containing protein, partial [Bacteroidales bacterium]
NLEDDFFKPHEGEFETLAGLILENLGRFPQKNEKIDFDRFSFVVEAMDAKRIKRIKMIINHEES